MTQYLIFFLVLIFFAALDFTALNKKTYNKFFSYFFLVLIFFVGFRYKIANDWYNYLNFTKNIDSFDKVLLGTATNIYVENSMEWGFKLLISIINLFFNPENNSSLQALTFVITLFNYFVLFKVVKNEDSIKFKFLFISTYVGFTLFREFDILRQSLAFYIFLLSLKYIGNNFKKYLIVNVIGSFFHSSAIIFIPLYWFFQIRIPRWVVYILLFFHCFTMFVHFTLLSNILAYLGNYFPELIFVQKVYNYASEFDGGKSLNLVGILYTLYLILLILNYKNLKSTSQIGNIFINCFYIFIFINIFFSESKEIADRFSYFFYFGLAFIFVISIDLLPRSILYPYLLLVFLFPYIRFTRVIADPKTKSVIVPYRNYFFINRSDEDEILRNWENKNEEFLH